MFRIIGPILSILIACAALYFFVRPMFFEMQGIQSEARAYDEAIDKAGEFNTLLESLLQKKNSFSALELERLETLIPSEIDGVHTLVDLERLATRHGLLFDQVTIDLEKGTEGDIPEEQVMVSGTTEEGLETLDISFSVVGGYPQFKAFLEDLERSLVLMDVTDLAFQAAEGEVTSYTVTVRLYALTGTPTL